MGLQMEQVDRVEVADRAAVDREVGVQVDLVKGDTQEVGHSYG